jgi:hypothetical protein
MTSVVAISTGSVDRAIVGRGSPSSSPKAMIRSAALPSGWQLVRVMVGAPRTERVVPDHPQVRRLHDHLLAVGVDPLPTLTVEHVDRVTLREPVDGVEGAAVGPTVARDGEVAGPAGLIRQG